MGMHYDVTFNDATIKPERYFDLLCKLGGYLPTDNLTEEDRAGMPAQALVAVDDLLDDWDGAVQDDDGIHLDGIGFHDSASYSYGDSLYSLLSFCEPGGYTHENDAENSSGEQWRSVVMPDRTVKTITGEVHFPGMDWPDNLPDLIAAARKALGVRGRESARLIHTEKALRALLDALDPQTPKEQ